MRAVRATPAARDQASGITSTRNVWSIRSRDITANTQLRDPAWNKGRRVSTLSVSPSDAESLGLVDGQMVRVTTEAGSVDIEAKISEAVRPGQVIIPHGFGLVFEGDTYGVNVNLLTKNTHRDRIAGTPHHRYVPCRVEGL